MLAPVPLSAQPDGPLVGRLTARELVTVAAPLLAASGTMLFLLAVFSPKMATFSKVGLVGVTTLGAVLAGSVAYQDVINKRRLAAR